MTTVIISISISKPISRNSLINSRTLSIILARPGCLNAMIHGKKPRGQKLLIIWVVNYTTAEKIIELGVTMNWAGWGEALVTRFMCHNRHVVN